MKTIQLTVSDPGFLAEFVRQEEFRAFFEKRLEVPPDYLGLLMRNGQFVQAVKGAHFSVGGLFHQLKGIVGGSSAISLMIADLKTFQATYRVVARTKDKVDVDGDVTLDLQINPEKPQNILGMMTARKALTKDEVAGRIKPHMWERVFEAALSRVNANEVRGNKGLQDLIQADVMKEVERVAGDLGLLIRAVSVNWAINEVEKAEAQRAAAVREADRLEFEFQTLKRSMERENETTEIKITSKRDADKLNLQSEADLERLVLDQELSFVDARETGKRVQEMKVLEHEINMLKTERLAKFAGEIQQATHAGVDLKVVDERRRVIERNTEMLDREHGLKLRALERDYESESRGLQREEDRGVHRYDRDYDRESRTLQRDEDRGNRLEDREDEKVRRKEDRDYDYDTRDKNLDIQGKERDFNFDTRKKEVDVGDKEEFARLARQRENDKVTRDRLKDLQDLEKDIERDRLDRRIKEDDAGHFRDMDVRKLDAQKEVDRMQLGAKMTPEQILAINAGLSPAVAKVLEEQAKAKAADKTEQMELMRQMVEQANRARIQSEEQARTMFQAGMTGAAGVAAGAGGKAAPPKAEGEKADTVECPKCTRVNPAKAKFCVGCGEQLRR